MEHAENQAPTWQLFWAKTSSRMDKNRVYHPLLCHMLDVAAVAALVWDNCITPMLRKRIECSLGIDARTQIVFFCRSARYWES